jgi:cytochrome c biogenesis protein CcdA/thiol-disulfide isomerase/thioredoxin
VRSKTRPLFITLGFVVSFSVVALLISYLTQHLGLDPNTLRTAAVVLLGAFALFMIWPTPFERLMAHFSGLLNRAAVMGQQTGQGNLGGFVLGMIIGILWAPCAGPILGSILTLVALQENLGEASLLLVAYAVGAGLPMLAIAYGGQALTTKIKSISKYAQRLQQGFGIILLLLATAVYFQYDTVVQAALVKRLPVFSVTLEEKLTSAFSPAAPGTKNDYGAAPDFVGIANWLNTDPLKIADLRGKVVLVDFWTYSCINCIRTLPYITKWYDKYQDEGLVIVGVHTPEFAFEENTNNVATALVQHGIRYPVAQDNDYQTWRAYNNRYWPAKYLIDQNGRIVYTHFGEGNYEETEAAIRSLLGLSSVDGEEEKPRASSKSPEMYLGTDRIANLAPQQKPSADAATYILPPSLLLNQFALAGEWRFSPEFVSTVAPGARVRLRFNAGKVFMVASASKPATISVLVDDEPQPDVVVSAATLYTLFDSDDYREHTLEFIVPESGFELFTFTFG